MLHFMKGDYWPGQVYIVLISFMGRRIAEWAQRTQRLIVTLEWGTFDIKK